MTSLTTSQQNKNSNNNNKVKCHFIYYIKMDVNFIYYKELSLLDENIFLANLSQNNKIEKIFLKKFKPAHDCKLKNKSKNRYNRN